MPQNSKISYSLHQQGFLEPLPCMVFAQKINGFEFPTTSFSDYNCFGMQIEERTYSESANSKYRFGFNGKQKDDELYGEGNAYDFGARLYNPQICLFLSIDPRHADFPWLSPYVFAANNPIRYIDVNGEGPGDMFASEEEAAVDFANTYNPNSIRDNKEYGAFIYATQVDGSMMYSYSVPNVGTEFSVNITTPDPEIDIVDNMYVVSEIHTHGAFNEELVDKNRKGIVTWDGNNEFSGYPGDKDYAESNNMPFWKVSPNGSIELYTPSTAYNTSTVYTSPYIAPADVNDPSAKGDNLIKPDSPKDDVPTLPNGRTPKMFDFLRNNLPKYEEEN